MWNARNKPREVVADKAYGTMRFYRYLKGPKISPAIPNRNLQRSLRKRKLEAGFTYDPVKDVYTCSKGRTLHKMKSVRTSAGRYHYRVHRLACRGCEYSGTLCKTKRPTVVRSEDDAVLLKVLSHLATPRARMSQPIKMPAMQVKKAA